MRASKRKPESSVSYCFESTSETATVPYSVCMSICGRSTVAAPADSCLVFGSVVHMIDNHYLNRSPARFQLKPELFLHHRENRRTGIGRRGDGLRRPGVPHARGRLRGAA